MDDQTPTPSHKTPKRGTVCERCHTRGPRFTDGEPLDIRYRITASGESKFLCFRCRAAEALLLEERKRVVERKIKLLKEKPIEVPELDEADHIRLKGMGVKWPKEESKEVLTMATQ